MERIGPLKLGTEGTSGGFQARGLDGRFGGSFTEDGWMDGWMERRDGI